MIIVPYNTTMPEKEPKFINQETEKSSQEVEDKIEGKEKAIKIIAVEKMQERMKKIVENKCTEVDMGAVVEPQQVEGLVWNKLREIYEENPEVVGVGGASPLELFIQSQEVYKFPLLALRSLALKSEDDPKKKEFYRVFFDYLIERHETDMDFLKKHGQLREFWIEFTNEKLRELRGICPNFIKADFPFCRHISYKERGDSHSIQQEVNHTAGTATMPIAKLVVALESWIEDYNRKRSTLGRLESLERGMVNKFRSLPSDSRPEMVRSLFREVEERFSELFKKFE